MRARGSRQFFVVLAATAAALLVGGPRRGGAERVPVQRHGSVDLGILAETTPLVWKDELWLLECIQGGRYYGNINFTSYPNEPQPAGYLRFTNPLTGERSAPFARGFGLGNALVVDGRIFVFATATPFGINSNNTVVATFWSDDMLVWKTSEALRVGQPGMFPPEVTSRLLFNTCVRPVPNRTSAGNATFVMTYEFSDPGAGWQTGIALTHDSDLRRATWTCVPRPTTAAAVDFGSLAHANPTLRWGNDGWWYLLSTRGTNGVLVEEIWRTRQVASFDWEAPPGWQRKDATAAAFLAPSHEDQLPLRNGWHPDTFPVVAGNASKVSAAKNDNVSDLDLCTITLPGGEVATIFYYAWGDQELGPTAMVLAMAMVKGVSEAEVLASHFTPASDRIE